MRWQAGTERAAVCLEGWKSNLAAAWVLQSASFLIVCIARSNLRSLNLPDKFSISFSSSVQVWEICSVSPHGNIMNGQFGINVVKLNCLHSLFVHSMKHMMVRWLTSLEKSIQVWTQSVQDELKMISSYTRGYQNTLFSLKSSVKVEWWERAKWDFLGAAVLQYSTEELNTAFCSVHWVENNLSCPARAVSAKHRQHVALGCFLECSRTTVSNSHFLSLSVSSRHIL